MEKHTANNMTFVKPVLGFAAYSGTGKTTLLEKLLPLMKLQGLRVAMIKQTHHDFEIDKPGKDSFRLREAGAEQVLLTSAKRCVVITEYEEPKEPDLYELIDKLDLESIDLIMVEGFKYLPFAKIELYRAECDKKLLYPEDDSVIAVASDKDLEAGNLPLLNLKAPEEIAGFINSWLEKMSNRY
jgi:molybdopterin-guanine dinucleotide biosynthesis protein B